LVWLLLLLPWSEIQNFWILCHQYPTTIALCKRTGQNIYIPSNFNLTINRAVSSFSDNGPQYRLREGLQCTDSGQRVLPTQYSSARTLIGNIVGGFVSRLVVAKACKWVSTWIGNRLKHRSSWRIEACIESSLGL
jgi:hypothetical protein